jgi:hypothetical protein
LATRPHQIGVCFAFDVIHAIALTIRTIHHGISRREKKKGRGLSVFC